MGTLFKRWNALVLDAENINTSILHRLRLNNIRRFFPQLCKYNNEGFSELYPSVQDPATFSEFEHAPLLMEPKSESNGGIGHVVFILSARVGPHFLEN